jgi:exodeoxyribonuclease III
MPRSRSIQSWLLPEPMKVASFNINNINRRLTNLLNWLHEAQPDIVCLQELKATDAEFLADAIGQAGYHAVWRGEQRWNGVAILARWAPVVTRMELPGDAADAQCRYLEAAVNGVLVASIYAPNGNPQPGPKFDYKLAWLRRLTSHAAELYATGAPVVLAGDYNIVPTDLDIYPSKSWDRNALLQPQSRAAYQALLAQGWTDAIRALHPKERVYTFWDYMRHRWERDGGLRLDHILLSSALTERLQGAGVDRQTRGMEDASDHAPAWVILRDGLGHHGAGSRQTRRQTIAATTMPSPKANPSTHRISDGTIQKRRSAKIGRPALSGRPLLVIDGDSFAHRSYHALPKTIRRSDGRAAGAILGFAYFVLRLDSDERPRAVIVGWDTLEAPTKRHEMFPAYQSGREFDDDLIEQLNVLPELVAAFGFANAKAAGYERTTFSPPQLLRRNAVAALPSWRAATGILFSSPRRARRSSTRRGVEKSRALDRRRSGNDMASIQNRSRTSLRYAVTLLTNCLAPPGSAQNAPLNWCNGTARLMASLKPVSFNRRLRCCASIG